jgi:hypothetical protein
MVAEDCRGLLRAERCEVHLFDGTERLVLRAASPRRSGGRPLDTRRLWIDALAGVPAPEDAKTLADALWGDQVAGTPVFAPLAVGEERLGILAAVVPAASGDAQSVLSAVASHVAVALKQHQLIDWLKEENLVKEFFEALARGDDGGEEVERAAARLGCDLDAPHAVLHVRAWDRGATGGSRRGRAGRPRVDHPEAPPWRDAATRLEARLASAMPGALFDRRETSVRALLPAGGRHGDPVAAVRSAYAEIGGDDGAGISVGISNPCRGVSSFAAGFDEAQSSAEVGPLIRGAPGVFTYEDLGPYKYVLSTESGVRDRHQLALDRLAEYDERRGSQLLRTLEGYLDGRGNVVGSSRALFIHPNTLRQRLARIEHVTGFALEHEDWLSLAIAVKVVKLRLMRRSARHERKGSDA